MKNYLNILLAWLVVGFSLYGQYVTDPNTVLLMHLDETSVTNFLDQSGWNNNGTSAGTISNTTGFYNNAKCFTGGSNGSYINIPHNSNLAPTSQITVECWVKPSNITQSSTILRKSNGGQIAGYQLAMYYEGKINFQLIRSSNPINCQGNTILTPNIWTHVAGTFDGTALKVYVNGIFDGQFNYSGAIEQSSSPLGIGAVPRTSDNDGFLGCIDEVRISNIARNSFIPVELSSFSCFLENQKVELRWTTATELNNSGFEIERSTDLQNWDMIGFVKGNGTSTSEHSYFFQDIDCVVDGEYYYRLKQIDFNGKFSYSQIVDATVNFVPKVLVLNQNYPNPFNPITLIKYALPKASHVVIKIFDILGNELETLVDEYQYEGYYTTQFDANKLSSGVYIYRIQAGTFVQNRKMILMK